MRRWHPRKTADVIVIGSERMLDEADAPELEFAASRIDGSADPKEHSLRRGESAAWVRTPAGRMLAAGAFVAVVGIAAGVLAGRGGDERSSASNELAVRQAPPTFDRVAPPDSRRPDRTRAGTAVAKPRHAGEPERDGEVSRGRTQDDGAHTASATGPAGQRPPEEAAPVGSAAPVVVESAPPPSPPAPSSDTGGAVVPASGAEVREEFGP